MILMLAKLENHYVNLPEDKTITRLYNSGDDIMSLNSLLKVNQQNSIFFL